MKKTYIKPVIEAVEIEGDTILAGSSQSKETKKWKVEGADLTYDYNENNADASTGSLSKDYEFSFAEDFEYDF